MEIGLLHDAETQVEPKPLRQSEEEERGFPDHERMARMLFGLSLAMAAKKKNSSLRFQIPGLSLCLSPLDAHFYFLHGLRNTS